MHLIGVDVGGTNTDAVRLRDGDIAAWAKVTSTPRPRLRRRSSPADGGAPTHMHGATRAP